MPRWLLFRSASLSFIAIAALGACNGDKVQTPTSDKNYDDGDDPGSGMVTVPPGEGGVADAARPRDSGADGAHDASIDALGDSPANADATNDSADSATDAPTSD